MKRKQFVKKIGVGVTALYLGNVLSACHKDKLITPLQVTTVDPPPSPKPQVTVVDGYTEKLSYYPGETVRVFINAAVQGEFNLSLYTADKVLVDTISDTFSPQLHGDQPSANGYNYANSTSYVIKGDLKSGLYFWENKIPFVVKNPKKNGTIVALLPSNTDNAYNSVGGFSSYTVPMSPVLSYQRPYRLAEWSESFWPWACTLPYQIDYIIDSDLEDYSNFSYATILLIPGHSEYWTKKARLNFDMFIDSGRHSLILSGNVMWWQIRYSDDGTQMLCYKHIKDPVKDVQYYTTNWFERVLKYPIEKSFGMNFNLGGYGISSGVGWHGYKIVNESSPLLVGTGLKNGDIISCPSNEYDGAPIKYIPGQEDPVLDNIYNFHKIEMIGYDHSFRLVKTAGTFIALQKTETSGTIVNTASTDWCAKTGLEGRDGDKLKLITINAINLLLENKSVFSLTT